MRALLPYDGSPSARRALELVAGYPGLTLRLLNVQPQSADAGHAVLREALASLPGAEAQVRIGRPAPAIVQESTELIVMGTRGSGSLQGFAFGSVALRVAQAAAAPVLLVKPDDRLPAEPGRKLRALLAMDGSAPAVRAAERLAQWRGWLGELDVQLAHVDVGDEWTSREEAAQAAREILRRAGIAHHLHLSVGDPALEIRDLAQKTGAELVVLGTRGLGAAHHAFIGSVALKAAALCAVPALLVH
jgi:nucleotide-binding universal stress UspA family protein